MGRTGGVAGAPRTFKEKGTNGESVGDTAC